MYLHLTNKINTMLILVLTILITLSSKITRVTASNPFILDKFLLFGDSHIQLSSNTKLGFALSPALQDDYNRALNIETYGFSGYNSRWARYIINPLMDAVTADGSDLKLMLIYFGTNDARLSKTHVELNEYKTNIEFLTTEAKKRAEKVILVGPGLCSEHRRYTKCKNKDFRKYSKAVKNIATKHEVAFVDLRSALLKYLKWQKGDPVPGDIGARNFSKLTVDGIHLSSMGYRVFYNELKSVIAEYYPEMVPSKFTRIMPLYFEVDNDNIEKSLYGYSIVGKLRGFVLIISMISCLLIATGGITMVLYSLTKVYSRMGREKTHIAINIV